MFLILWRIPRRTRISSITNSGTVTTITVCIVTRLRAGRSDVQVPARARDFSLLQNVQTCCGAHPASCSVGMRPLVPGVKRLWREAYQSPPSSAED